MMQRGVKIAQVLNCRQQVTHSFFGIFTIVKFYWIGTNSCHQQNGAALFTSQAQKAAHHNVFPVACYGSFILMSSRKRSSSDISPTTHSAASDLSDKSEGSESSDKEEQSSEEDDKNDEDDLCSHCGSPKKSAKENNESEEGLTINKMSDSSDEDP